MYYSIEKLKEYNWNLKKYLKEEAIRSFGICASLRDDDRKFSQEGLRQYFASLDREHAEQRKRNIEEPLKPSEEDLRFKYDDRLDKLSKDISEEAKNIRDLKQISVDVNTALSKVAKENKLLYKMLLKLKGEIECELESKTDLLTYLQKELTKSYEDFVNSELNIYERMCKRTKEESLIEDTWESYEKIYNDFKQLDILKEKHQNNVYIQEEDRG